MNGPADDEHLHREMDGELTPEEVERLRARVAADPALGVRAEGLKRLAAMVNGLGPEEPPAGFSDRVMAEVATAPHSRPAWHRRLASLPAAIGRQLFPGFAHHLGQSHHQPETFRRAGMAGGGVIVAKKVLWGVAGLAVIVILAVVYFNGRTVDQGAQGTIGAADRYRGAQPSGVNATPGNAQAFLQSDTFDKIVKNKDVRSLLGSPELCSLLANDAVEAALKDDGVEAALKNEHLMAALADADVEAALKQASLQAFLADADVQAALKDDAVEAALESPGMEAALKDKGAAALFADPDVQAALKNQAGLAKLFEDAQAALKQSALKGQASLKGQAALKSQAAIQAALQNKLFAAMLADGAVEAALKSQNGLMASLLTDDSFQAALKNQSSLMASLMTDDAFQAALKPFAALAGNDAFEAALKGGAASLFANLQFQSALKDPDFRGVMGNADFEAALKNQEALQSALLRVK